MIYERLKKISEMIVNTTCTTSDDILELEEAFSLFKEKLLKAQNTNGITYVIGNGGSAGIASHFCNDLLKTLKIPSSTLVDASVLTCLANDYGYEKCYSEALKVISKSDDVLVAISSSGNSLNIVNAVRVAKEKGSFVITFSGFDSANPLRQIGDLNFWLDKKDYGLVEMGHMFLLHSIVDLFEKINIKKSDLVTSKNA
ncbi:MAG: Phosphoheptose isomerase [Candidatus Anoxychlamydiales bacterium]|nr:Phosphoheptose isomerase [Candidatus Anoxychlamydiales bacterium]